MANKTKTKQEEPLEKKLWKAVDKLPKNMDTTSLKGVLTRVYACEDFDKQSLGGLIDLIGTIEFMAGDAQIDKKCKDLLGNLYEYFLGEFPLAEGKKSGEFYTPVSVVSLLVEMLESCDGRVFDPCCNSGGMFVQSENFTL